MKIVLAILFATVFTYLVSLLAGKLLLQLLGVKLARMEEHFLGFVLGAACSSTIVFSLTAAGLARRGIFLSVGAAIIAIAIWRGAHRFSTGPGSALPKHWTVVFGLVYVAFGVLYLGNAMQPEASPDGVGYHVALVARYLREHHFPRITTSLHASFPEGAEMLFLFAFAFGRHTAAAMVHLLFTLITPFGMLAYGRRIGSPRAGATGALLFFLSPIVGKAGTSAYVDLALASAIVAVLLLLEIWRQEQQSTLLAAIGLCAGFAFAVKYPGGIAIFYALAAVILYLWKAHRPFVRPAILVAACALFIAAPWMLKNLIMVRNPVAPFANQLFPNPFVSPWAEKTISHTLHVHKNVTLLELPREATVGGGRVPGVMGPVFLLAPLLLIGLGSPVGRRMVFAALLFAIPYYVDPDTRYAIPSLAFVSFGIALVLMRRPAIAVAILLLHAAASWPPILKTYVHPYAWRIDEVDWKAALRITPEADFLRRHLGDYDAGLMIERTVPPGEPVFSFFGIQQAYHSHEIIVGWTSSSGVRISETLRTPFTKTLQPTRPDDYRFPPVTAQKIRLTQTARSENDRWSITELRVYRQGQELPRAPQWRLRASNNPWDVTLAFDNSPVTRWTSGEAYKPGMYVEIDFSRPESIDQVLAECTRDQEQMRMRLEYEAAPGEWRTILASASIHDAPGPASLRGAAIQEVERNHVHWLLIHDAEDGASDFFRYRQLWGIRLAASEGPYKLYQLE